MKNTNTYSNKTDLEVIEIYKNNSHWRTKQDIETYFYKKYSPLCKTISYKYRYISSMEDNMQDCYFLMLDALDWVDTNKITDTVNFSFGYVFKKYLTPHFIQQQKVNSRVEEHIKIESLDPLEQEDNFRQHVLATVPSFESNLIFKITYDRFKKQLDPKNLAIINLLEQNERVKDIAEKLSLSNATIYKNKIQQMYIQFMNKSGYEIAM